MVNTHALSMKIHGNENLLEIYYETAERIFYRGLIKTKKINEKNLSVIYVKRKNCRTVVSLSTRKSFLSLKFDLVSSHFRFLPSAPTPTWRSLCVYCLRQGMEKSTIWEVENVNSFFVGGWKIYDVAREEENERKNLSTMWINRSILCNNFKVQFFPLSFRPFFSSSMSAG